MDAVKFIREEIRMCAKIGTCCDCPLCSTIYCTAAPSKRSQEEAEEIVRQVEKWSSAHPRKTRQSKFLEQYPNAKIDERNVLCACPANVYGDEVCLDDSTLCSDCCRDFWNQEVE